MKALPTIPLSAQAPCTYKQNGHPTINPVSKDLPHPPATRASFSSVESRPLARDPHQRVSMPLPPIVATPSLLSGRFYSSLQSGEPSAAAQHTRTKSQPMLSPQSVSPFGGSDSDNSVLSPRKLSDTSQVEERTPSQEREREDVQPPIPPKSPDVHPHPDDNPNLPKDTSNLSASSTHPHRGEARLVNETPEPVELAATRDDSSEEIIMSPTSYPGQEWTPLNYY